MYEVQRDIVRDPEFNKCFEIVTVKQNNKEERILRCMACNIKYKWNKTRAKERAKEHVNGRTHRNLMKSRLQPSVSNVLGNVFKRNDEVGELIEGCLVAGIEPNKLQNEVLNKVLEKKFGKIPTAKEITQRYLSKSYQEKRGKMKTMMQGKPVYIVTVRIG